MTQAFLTWLALNVAFVLGWLAGHKRGRAKGWAAAWRRRQGYDDDDD